MSSSARLVFLQTELCCMGEKLHSVFLYHSRWHTESVMNMKTVAMTCKNIKHLYKIQIKLRYLYAKENTSSFQQGTAG